MNWNETGVFVFKPIPVNGTGCIRTASIRNSSSLERIGAQCFEDTGIEKTSIPDSVHEFVVMAMGC